MYAQGGASLAASRRLRPGVARHPVRRALGLRRPQTARSRQAARGQAARRPRRSSRCPRTASQGSAAPADLETALQLLYQDFTRPATTPMSFVADEAAARSRGRQPRPGVPARSLARRLDQINTSNHYTSQPLTAERVATLDRAKMLAFYRERFSNAADFTFFMVGAFKLDTAIPLLARYVGSLPSTGRRTSEFKDSASASPSAIVRDSVEKGREPRSQTVISFFADRAARRDRTGDASSPRRWSSRTRCATCCAKISARPTRFGVGLSQSLAAARRRPCPGQLRRGPGEHPGDDRSRAAGDQEAAAAGTVGRSRRKGEGIGAARLRNVAERERLLDGPAAAVHLHRRQPGRDPDASAAHRRVTPAVVQETSSRNTSRSIATPWSRCCRKRGGRGRSAVTAGQMQPNSREVQQEESR